MTGTLQFLNQSIAYGFVLHFFWQLFQSIDTSYFNEICEVTLQIIFFPSTDYPIFYFLKNESFPLIWNVTFIIFWIFASPSILKPSSFWTMLPFASVILDFLTLLQHKENLSPLHINLCLSTLFWTKYLSFFPHQPREKQVWLIALSNSSVTDGVDRAINTSGIIVLKNMCFS